MYGFSVAQVDLGQNVGLCNNLEISKVTVFLVKRSCHKFIFKWLFKPRGKMAFTLLRSRYIL